MPGIGTVLPLAAIALSVLAVLAWQGNKYNSADWGHPVLNVLDGLNVWFCRGFHRLRPTSIALPRSGPCILLSNHVSGLDPMLLLAATNRPLRFMIAQEEYERWWLKWLLAWMGCIPVKRDRNPRKALQESLAALRRGEVLVVFPEGGIEPRRAKRPLKPGAFRLARLSGAPVTAVRIEGIAGRGHTIGAVFMRSRARINQIREFLWAEEVNPHEIMARVAAFLEL